MAQNWKREEAEQTATSWSLQVSGNESILSCKALEAWLIPTSTNWGCNYHFVLLHHLQYYFRKLEMMKMSKPWSGVVVTLDPILV